MTFHIEQLATADATSITQLTRLVQQLSSAADEEYSRDAIESPYNQVLIARTDEGTVVGTATVATIRCLSGRRVHIEDVVVDTAYRNQGIATILLKEAVEQAKQTGARTIDMTSRPDRKAANALYKKLGFVQRDTNVYRYNAN
ncbi:hypothetical protein DFQ28_002117 [Apophysomyces sp. BC1034]|nr:hypothetical protein DFQ30_010346 [Apophysomyces sp. BC1015]KAG0183548.1 hypothetical protein DFQ29_002603 [Apophysomyces sp. BC1021]KAG0194008.1 hypothetical protein DFQ28_002117 [Apophysomyces sp. BC1034]